MSMLTLPVAMTLRGLNPPASKSFGNSLQLSRLALNTLQASVFLRKVILYWPAFVPEKSSELPFAWDFFGLKAFSVSWIMPLDSLEALVMLSLNFRGANLLLNTST